MQKCRRKSDFFQRAYIPPSLEEFAKKFPFSRFERLQPGKVGNLIKIVSRLDNLDYWNLTMHRVLIEKYITQGSDRIVPSGRILI